MLEAQLHALALVTAVYPFPNVTPLDTLPLPQLSEAE